MNVAMIYPAHVGVIEKTAALFGHVDVLMVPPSIPDLANKLKYNKAQLQADGPVLGFSTRWIPLPEADLDSYDALIDTWEARRWEPSWHELAWQIDVPRILKISWFRPQTLKITAEDRAMFQRSVVLTDSLVAADYWNAANIPAHFLPWFPGDWWFDQTWTGEDARVLFLLAGAYRWRGGPAKQPRLQDWLALKAWVPGYHLDGGERHRETLELAEEVARFRCYTNLDGEGSSRHLSLSFTEAMAAGVPCLVIDRPQHDYAKNIRDGATGYVCCDLGELADKAQALIDDLKLARKMSANTKELAEERFGRRAVAAEWERAIDRARYLHRKGKP